MQFGLFSPWNRFSTSGPQIIGSDGPSCGCCTINLALHRGHSQREA
jgi:hypothetical protein